MTQMIAVFAPLVGFIITGLLGRVIGDRAAQFITSALAGLACITAWRIFIDFAVTGVEPFNIHILNWLDVGTLKASWELRFDPLSALMLVVVTTVSFFVHIYSIGYMSHDKSIPRFMAYLSLFTFMMLSLVTASNLVQLFFGWEGVGLASYLLIGFWYHKDSANEAAIKAFVVNRVGDLGLVLGLGLIYMTFNTLNISEILVNASSFQGTTFTMFGNQIPILEVAAVLLFIGAMGKSAQLGLHVWLPDAMEGPTPVSALIHAATMVTAGVFLVCRMSPIYELAPYAKQIVMVVGATTAFFAGTVALTQNDIKRVIAYSTCSQLGYMFFAAGASAYSAAMFHLTTHAFFKALLFLGAGAVIHAMSDEQDMRNMGGIWRKLPFTYSFMWIGNLALAGMPFFAGYYSKELIMASTWLSQDWAGTYAFVLGAGSAFLTAFYSWRLLWMTFHGKVRANEKVMAHIHESPISMMFPMVLLAIGAMFSGYAADMMGWFTFSADKFWQDSLALPIAFEQIESVPHGVAYLVKSMGILGILLAIAFYGPWRNIPNLLEANLNFLYKFSLNKWYFDELYELLFVRTAKIIGNLLWQQGDLKTIDAYGPDGLSEFTKKIAGRASVLQTGLIYNYTLAMAVGLVAMIFWYILLFRG